MRRGLYGYRRNGRVDAQIGAAEIRDIGQFRFDHRFPEVRCIEIDVVVEPPVPRMPFPACISGHYRPRDHVAGSKIEELGAYRSMNRSPLLLRKIPPSPATASVMSIPIPRDSGGMKLEKFHVFEGTPARASTAGPSPVLAWALEVVPNMRPNPPVAMSTAFARSHEAARSGQLQRHYAAAFSVVNYNIDKL